MILADSRSASSQCDVSHIFAYARAQYLCYGIQLTTCVAFIWYSIV